MARKVGEPVRDQRLVVLVTKGEMAAIEEFRFSQRFASRGEAVRAALLDVLESLKIPITEPDG